MIVGRRKHKWIYTPSHYEKDTIYKILRNDEIDTKKCCRVFADSVIKKIRPGFIKEKTLDTKQEESGSKK